MTRTVLKFGVFCAVMVVLTTFLFFIFGQYRTGSSTTYSAEFTNVSRLKPGDSVRISGIRIGSVEDVSLQPDKKVIVTFDADRDVQLTSGTSAAVRYLNLVGDRYLELLDGPGSTRILPAGEQIPAERTQPALNLDSLLGGLKPVIQGLNPQDVNALTASLVQILQGQGDTVQSLLTETASFTNTLADKNQVIQQVIDNLRTVLATFSRDGTQFTNTIARLDTLLTGLSQDRDPIGGAIDSLSTGTASLGDLLTNARPPLKATVDQLNRLAPELDGPDLAKLETALQKAPHNYFKLNRVGSYGSFINFYLCGISARVTDLQGRTAVFPWVKNNGGRCADS